MPVFALDDPRNGFTIKIVEKKGASRVQDSVTRRQPRVDARPHELRVNRDNGGGLWTFEDQDGQLYLAVLSREVRRFRETDGARHKWPFGRRSPGQVAREA